MMPTIESALLPPDPASFNHDGKLTTIVEGHKAFGQRYSGLRGLRASEAREGVAGSAGQGANVRHRIGGVFLAPRVSGCGALLPELVGERREVPHDAGREPLEQRKELMTHTDAQEAGISVRGVRRVRKLVPGEVGEDILPASADERPDEVASARWQHGEPPGACAA
jgi:hypothetical protein